jgi:diaminopimelate epimerase
MFNADGSRAQMCGNGIRCVGKLAYERGWARQNPLRVQTDAGVLGLELTVTRSPAGEVVHEVRVDMGAPVLEAARIPVALDGATVIRAPLALPGRVLQMTCVSMGNPHAVIYVQGLKSVPLNDWGPKLEKHPLFPERMNIHFVAVDHAEYVRMITWERGAGATQACGTGASAVCVAGVLNGLTKRKITAKLPGGELKLEWDEATNHVFMTGPAEEVFTGVWP